MDRDYGVERYLHELSRLEDDCADFSSRYPLIAGRLGFGRSGVADPHVKQLLEGVAFLSSQLREEIERVPNEIAYQILQACVPSLTRSSPSHAVVQMTPGDRAVEGGVVGGRSVFTARGQGRGKDVFLSLAERECQLVALTVRAFMAGRERAEVIGFPQFVAPDALVLEISALNATLPILVEGRLDLFVAGPVDRAERTVEALVMGAQRARLLDENGVVIGSVLLGPRPVELDERGRADKMSYYESVDNLFERHCRLRAAGCFVRIEHLRLQAGQKRNWLVIEPEPDYISDLAFASDNVLTNCVIVRNEMVSRGRVIPVRQGRRVYDLTRECATAVDEEIVEILGVSAVAGQAAPAPLARAGEVSVGHHQAVRWASSRTVRGRARQHDVSGVSLSLVEEAGDGHSSVESDFAHMAAVKVDYAWCQLEAAHALHPGQPLAAEGMPAGWIARLATSPQGYMPAITPLDKRLPQLLSLVRHQPPSMHGNPPSSDELEALIRLHTVSDKTARQWSAMVRSLESSVVAIPFPIHAGVPGTVLATRYHLKLDYRDDYPGSRMQIACLVKGYLQLSARSAEPIELTISDRFGKTRVI